MSITDLTKHPKYLARKHHRDGSNWTPGDNRALLRMQRDGASMAELVTDQRRSPAEIRKRLRQLTLNGQLDLAEAAQHYEQRQQPTRANAPTVADAAGKGEPGG